MLRSRHLLQCVDLWYNSSATTLVRPGGTLHCKMAGSLVQHIVCMQPVKVVTVHVLQRYCNLHKHLEEEEEEEFYMLWPVNKTDHMQQGMNVLA